MRKASLTVNVDDDQVEWLRQQAELRRCSISQMIRTLIAEAQRALEEPK